jgi:hypothetical protein
MNIARQIISVMLAVAIVASGLPLFSPEDASRDGMVDLQDAILLVKDLAVTAEKPDSFAASFRKTLSAIAVVAGLKQRTAQDNSDKSAPTKSQSITFPDLTCLLSAFQLPSPATSSILYGEQISHYRSLTISPASPPPRVTPFC